MSKFVTLVNRSSQVLQGTWDGKHYDIAPGKHSFPEIQAQKFKDQNPLMGSEDPRTLQRTSLIGIVEHGDDVTPLEQSNSVERWDRKAVGGNVEVIRGNGGLYSTEKHATLPFDSSFVKA